MHKVLPTAVRFHLLGPRNRPISFIPQAAIFPPLKKIFGVSLKLANVGSLANDRVSAADCDRAFEPGAKVARRAALPLRVVDVTE